MDPNSGEWSWDNLVAMASAIVGSAQEGDARAGMAIVSQSAVALRDLLQHGISPSPERIVYLHALLESLSRIEQGVHPDRALNLCKPEHRAADPNLPVRDVLLFVEVGKEVDRLIERGHTRADKPVERAIDIVVKNSGTSAETVQKAWANYGALKGWQIRKADWK